MRRLVVLFLVLFTTVYTYADQAAFEKADQYHEDARYEEEFSLMEKALAAAGSSSEKAEILWRMSRAALSITDQLERDGADKDKLLEEFQKAQDYATESISYNSDNYNAYYWRAANIGRWGQTKGILDSLFKADDMRDDLERAINSNPSHGDSFNVLGMLYDSVPGVISFGNKSYSVSLARKAVDNQDTKGREYTYSYYLELAKHLWNRKWNERKRTGEQKDQKGEYSSAGSVLEKNWYYEGTVDLARPTAYSRQGVKKMSDREEAVAILKWLIPELKSLSNKKPGDYDDIKEAEELLAEWE